MALNANIPLQAKVINLSQAGQSFFDEKARQEQLANQTAQSKQTTEALSLQNLNTREQARVKSTIQGAARLNTFLDSNDLEGANNFLQKRRETLLERQALGENVDTTETDEALQLLQENPEQLKATIQELVGFGQQLGLLKDPSSIKGQDPSAVKEFQFFNTLTPEQQVTFEGLKRASTGVRIDPATGQAVGIEGFADSTSNISRAKAAGKTRGELETELELAPSVIKAKEIAKKVGAEQGIQMAELDSRINGLPELQSLVIKLSELGKKATFTKAGQLADTTRRELGLPVGEGAVARKEYIALVDNSILPLLRQTFGAQFTENEGKSLKVTLGDPNASPEEKDAVLKSFIATKMNTIDTLKRGTSNSDSISEPAGQQALTIDFNDLPK